MEDTLYRHILGQAWQLTWKRKKLWLLGLFAVFWGDLGAYQTLNQTWERLGSASTTPLVGPLFPPISGLSTTEFALLLLAAFLALAVFFALVVLVTAARGGLIAELGSSVRAASKVRLRAALKKGIQHFFPLLGIGLLTRLDVLVFLVLVNPWLASSPSVLSFSGFVAAFVFSTLVSLMLALLGVYASALIMIEGRSFRESLRGALKIFARHWLVSIELGLILFALTMLVGLLAIAALVVLTMPLLFLGALAVFFKLPALLTVAVIVGALIYLALLLLTGSAFVTFQYAAWVLLYQRLRQDRAVAKVVRVTTRFGRLLHRQIA